MCVLWLAPVLFHRNRTQQHRDSFTGQLALKLMHVTTPMRIAVNAFVAIMSQTYFVEKPALVGCAALSRTMPSKADASFARR